MGVLIKDLSMGQKWRTVSFKVDKAKEIEKIRAEKQELIAEMQRQIDNLQEENAKLFNENVDKDDRHKRIKKQLNEAKYDLWRLRNPEGFNQF